MLLLQAFWWKDSVAFWLVCGELGRERLRTAKMSAPSELQKSVDNYTWLFFTLTKQNHEKEGSYTVIKNNHNFFSSLLNLYNNFCVA